MGPSSTPVESFLADVRALLVRTAGQLATLYTLALLSVVAAILPVLAWIFTPARTTSFAILGAAGLIAACAVIAALVLGGFAVRRRFSGQAAVARWVGTRSGSIASDLLSTVQLSQQQELAAPDGPAESAGRAADDSGVMPRRARALSERSPWSPELAAALRASTERRLAELRPHALLDQRWLKRATAVAATAALGHAAMWALAPGKMTAGWQHLLVPRHLPFDAQVLSSIPIVGDLDLTLNFPEYSRRAPLQLDSTAGDISALVGTRVAVTARLLVPAASVEIVLESDDGTATRIPAIATGDLVRSEFGISRSGRYRFAVSDSMGRRTLEASARSVEAQADTAPTVQLIAPADSLDVSNLRQIELAFVAEDDFGIAAAELVWESGADHGKKPVPLMEAAAQRAQGKILWDMSEVSLPAGADVRYWLEVRDTDNVAGPNVGRSRELRLKVVSPRERHEQTLAKQEELAEHMLTVLGRRLVLAGDDLAERDEITDKTAEVVVELGTLSAAYERDVHASPALRKVLTGLRERLDKWRTAEARLLAPAKGKPNVRLPAGRFAATDAKLVGELEDGVTLLADWLDRERLEGMLDLVDEVAGHQRRLRDLLEQHARTKDPRLKAEIERELRALDAAMAQLADQRSAMPQDVLDQFVHRDALDDSSQASCTAEVRKLFAAGDTKAAQAKLQQCSSELGRTTSSLEGSLDALRGDRFGEEQRKLDEVMNELADLARDQDDIAAEASRIFDEYAAKIERLSEDNQREAAKKIAGLLDKLRRRLAAMPEAGLTPFAQEELDIVQRRLVDLENMVDDGDLAEALAMAKQAKQSIDTIAGELDAALEDDPGSVFASDTERALEAAERARPVAKELVDTLSELAPAPRDVLSAEDKRALEVLRRRQAASRERGKRLGDRTKQLGDELPGDAGKEVGQRLQSALDHMASAEGRMRAMDPSGARQAARSASDALAEANRRTKGAARQRQEGAGIGDEPIRIPGAEEYRAPEQFREDILEAMKKKAPSGYDDMIRRYYQELIR
ncbi:MAG: hypothetical protein IPI49_18915 [Myxococcales bacterium]|nr:hypothetical protein [Myxococcales bacterium]